MSALVLIALGAAYGFCGYVSTGAEKAAYYAAASAWLAASCVISELRKRR